MRLGASAIPFEQKAPNGAMLSAFREAGIESLELCDYHPRFACDGAGFPHSTCDLATLDPVARKRSLDDHYKVVDLAPLWAAAFW